MAEQALRYNADKNRLALVPSSLIEGVAKVLTYGAKKYTIETPEGIIDGANNWRKGLPWMSVTDSLKRHLEAFVRGEDYDPESGLLHLEHVGCNIAFLLEYYKTHPEMDDRITLSKRVPRIGLDIDDVLCQFIEAWCEKHSCPIPENWVFDREIVQRFEELKDDKDFWLNMKPMTNPLELGFEPVCYITARSINPAFTEEWLHKNGFPAVTVHHVGFGGSKVDIAKKEKLDYFIDDRYNTFMELNKAGICCFLMSRPHNMKFDVGYRRIKDFKDFKERFL